MAVDVSICIRARIAAGLLPLPPDAPGKVWIGPGLGKICDACDEPVTAADREYEVDITDRTLRFHSECLAAWHRLRLERGSGLS